MFEVITSKPLIEVSNDIAKSMYSITQIKISDKLFVNKNNNICIDGYGIFRSISRKILGRNRLKSMKTIEKLFQKYFNIIDNIFEYEPNNDALLQFHLLLIDDYIQGLGNLKFTYENTKEIEIRVNVLLLKLFSIKKDIYNGNYLDTKRKRIYSV